METFWTLNILRLRYLERHFRSDIIYLFAKYFEGKLEHFFVYSIYCATAGGIRRDAHLDALLIVSRSP